MLALFVILNPIGNIPLYQGVTANATDDQKKIVARKAVIVVVIVLLVFAYLGDAILGALQITLNYIMIAGGLFIVVFAVKDAATGSTSNEPAVEKKKRSGGLLGADLDRIAIFPIAIPLLAGPGAISTVMVLNHPAYGVAKGLVDFSTALAILIDCFLVWVFFVSSTRLVRYMKPSIMLMIGKVMDILMGAIGISFVFRGVLAIFGIVTV